MTLAELAGLLNLSTTTVSRVLSGNAEKYRISKKTQKKVREAAEQHEFEVNQVARNLRLQQTNTIGLVIPDISNPFFGNLAKKVEIELRKRGKLIILCDTDDDVQIEKETLSLMISRKVDGLLLVPVGLSSDHLSKLKSLPTVMIDRYFQDLPIPHVSTNNYEGAYEATKYLIDRNHKKITCIQGISHTISNVERIKGFNQAIEDSSVSADHCEIIGSDFSLACGYEAAKEALSKKDRPTAIFALGNQIALGALKAIKENALSVPEDISIISFDEQPFFELTSPTITTVKQPIEQIGQVASELLFELMDKREVSSQLLPATLIERNSVKAI